MALAHACKAGPVPRPPANLTDVPDSTIVTRTIARRRSFRTVVEREVDILKLDLRV